MLIGLSAPSGGAMPRHFSGIVVRSYLNALQQKGQLAEVRARVPPGTAAQIDKPPFPVSWVPAAVIEDIARAVVDLHGHDAMRSVAHAAMHQSMGSLLRPLLSTTLSLFGNGPATLFSRLDAITSTVVKGASFSWTAKDEKSGTIEIRYDEPASDALYCAWEGVLSFAFDVTNVKGEMSVARLAEDGRSARIDASWE